MKKVALVRMLALPALAASLLAAGYLLVVSPAGAANLLRAALARISGEDPTVAGTVDPAFISSGDARLTDKGELRISMSFLDASRFPAGTPAEVRVGSLSSTAALVPFAPEAPGQTDNPLGATTMVDVRGAGTARAGDRAEVRIRSEAVVNGVRQRHETRWSGTLQ